MLYNDTTASSVSKSDMETIYGFDDDSRKEGQSIDKCDFVIVKVPGKESKTLQKHCKC